jgi:hypothetical protein
MSRFWILSLLFGFVVSVFGSFMFLAIRRCVCVCVCVFFFDTKVNIKTKGIAKSKSNKRKEEFKLLGKE